MGTADLPPIEGLIPHRGESLLLDRVLEHDAGSTSVRVVVGSPKFLEKADGTTAPWAALEYMSQCFALHESLLAEDDGGSRIPGYLTAAGWGSAYFPISARSTWNANPAKKACSPRGG